MTQPISGTTAIILAAGQGTRMKSASSKVMHAIAGRPLIYYSVQAALGAGCDEVVVVVGHGRAEIERFLAETFGASVRTAVQTSQRGTGDAAKAGLEAVSPTATRVVVFYGDVPLMVAEDIAKVVRTLGDADALAFATCTLEDATGYGRILRNAQGDVLEIREHKDLRNDQERAAREINPGIFAMKTAFLRDAVASLQPNNAQGEYYLTDIVSFARTSGRNVVTIDSRGEVLVGVNDRRQLAEAEEVMLARINEKWRKDGVTIRPGARIDEPVAIEPDVTIESGAVLRGKTRVERGSLIDVGSVLTNAQIGEGAIIKPYSVITDSTVGARAQIGPFAHLRPESHIGEEAHVGNFVETKKTRMDRGAKANHLAYLGDGIIGEGANVGAGTIFCNYDGFLKHTTTIEKGAFIGSDSQIVAPVRIGEGAYVATGTTVTRDVPAHALAISRTRQENKEDYAKKLKSKLQAAKEELLAKKAR